MRDYSFKIVMTALALFCLLPLMQAQFDDVYYDPDDVQTQSYDDDASYDYGNSDDVTYYDDDEYAYYDDYDYYYTSRIKRFYRPYAGFNFYDPVYVSYNYYDPFFHDSYYYPGASIYISFGNNDYWGYRNWRRWNRYNNWNHWGYSPANYYYSYNNWHHHDHHYWGGYHGYHSYSNYYNNYYNSCPMPISYYNGITNTTVTNINNGGTRGTYYGPRIAGGTGSSPRGPVDKPGSVQPVMRDGITGDTPTTSHGNDVGVTTPPRTQNPLPKENTPGVGRTDVPSNSDVPGKVGIEDKEITREESAPRSQRPVFKPYPSDSKPSGTVRTNPEQTSTKPVPETRPSGTDRQVDSPRPSTSSPAGSTRDDVKPQYQPTPRQNDERPAYTPRTEERPSYTPRTEERPRYTPPVRSEARPSQRTEEQPRYTPPARTERSESRPAERSSDSGRSRESYSPPSRSDNSSGRSYSPPSRSESSSSGSSRSNSSSGSPRSGGRG